MRHNPLTAEQRAASVMLSSRCRGLSSARTIEYLISNSLISFAHLRALVAREKVAKLVDGGTKKLCAIAAVAEEMGCSETTIRGYIYNNYK